MMKQHKTKAPVALGLITAGALLLTGCVSSGDETSPEGSSNGQEAAQVEKLTISTGTQFPPMGFVDPDTDELVGFDIDLGNAIGEKLGAEIDWQETVFNQFISSVESKRSDMILGSMLDTKERQETLTFIDYLSSGFQFFTTKEVAESQGIEEISDLCGKSVAASRNSTYKDSILEWSKENCDSKEAIKVLDTDGSPDARLQLKQGRVAAAMQTSESVSYLVNTEETMQAIGDPITESFYGIGFTQDNTELRDSVVQAFNEVIDDGTYDEIVEKWKLDGQGVKETMVDLKPVNQ